MNTQLSRAGSLNPGDPSIPRLTAPQRSPIRATRDELFATAEMPVEYTSRVARSPLSLPVRDLSYGFKGSGVSANRWPAGLFIPAGANYRDYWVTAPPAGSNRYTWNWTSGAEIDTASANDGSVFAYASLGPSKKYLRSEAGVRFVFTPRVPLASYQIDATLALTASYFYNFDTTEYADGNVTISAGVYISAWEIGAGGELHLVSPFSFQTLHREKIQGQAGTSKMTAPAATPFSAKIALQGGKAYLIGVTADVQITNESTMKNGGPMPSVLDPTSQWTVWCQVEGSVPQVLVTPV